MFKAVIESVSVFVWMFSILLAMNAYMLNDYWHAYACTPAQLTAAYLNFELWFCRLKSNCESWSIIRRGSVAFNQIVSSVSYCCCQLVNNVETRIKSEKQKLKEHIEHDPYKYALTHTQLELLLIDVAPIASKSIWWSDFHKKFNWTQMNIQIDSTRRHRSVFIDRVLMQHVEIYIILIVKCDCSRIVRS